MDDLKRSIVRVRLADTQSEGSLDFLAVSSTGQVLIVYIDIALAADRIRGGESVHVFAEDVNKIKAYLP